MATPPPNFGLYVGFEIQQDRALTLYIKGIPPAIGEPEDYANLTVECLAPEELASAGLGRDERRQLRPLVRKVGRELSKLEIAGAAFVPAEEEEGELVPHVAYAAIALDPPDVVVEARSNIARVIAESMNVQLPALNPQGWFLDVARRSKPGSKGLAPYLKQQPGRLVISGITVAVRSSTDRDIRPIRSYVQRPRNLRRR